MQFDWEIKLEFHGAKVSSDGGLLIYRGLDEALGLTDLAETMLSELRVGKNTRHTLKALLRQSVYSRLASQPNGSASRGGLCQRAFSGLNE